MKSLRTGKIALSGLVLLLAISGCASVPVSTTDKDESFAVRSLGDTPLGQLAIDLAGERPGSESGFLLLDRGHEA
jgi:hypothetical protein